MFNLRFQPFKLWQTMVFTPRLHKMLMHCLKLIQGHRKHSEFRWVNSKVDARFAYWQVVEQMPTLSAAKNNPFFQVQPNLGPNFRVQTGRVGPQDPKTGPVGSTSQRV